MMIGFMIRLWCDRYNMAITEFAELSGYDRKVVYRWISCESIPNKRSCRVIVDVFAHYAHWSNGVTEQAFIKLLDLRDIEEDWRRRKRKKNQ